MLDLNRSAIQTKLIHWFEQQGRDLPWRRTRDPYAVLVSECMLQQTQVGTVLDYYQRWMARFPTILDLSNAAESEVLKFWEGLGYYARARNLHKAAQQVQTQYGGIFPNQLPQIAQLPGIGRYTAGAVATFAFGYEVPIVDANIARVLARVFLIEDPTDTSLGQKKLWAAASELVVGTRLRARKYNSAIMELGALTCRPKTPRCLECPIHTECRSAHTSTPDRLPIKKERRKTVLLNENCAWIYHSQKGLLLEQQITGRRAVGLWKLPLLKTEPTAFETPIFETTYPFTHHRIRLRVYRVDQQGAVIPKENLQWNCKTKLDSIALIAPHRRAVDSLIIQT